MKRISCDSKIKVESKTILENHMKKLRQRVYLEQRDNLHRFENQIVSADKRKGMLQGEEVDRIVFFLRGTGCSQIKKNGGCTCCGFYSISNLGEKIDDKYYENKIDEIIADKEINLCDYKIVCLYNDGSLLNEEEFSFNVLIYMIKKLNEIQNIRKIVIEAKVRDITESKLKKIRECTDKDFEITIGYESSNEDVRQLCVNRPFSNIEFEHIVEITADNNIDLVPLLMVKPAFLTEKEAITDFIESLVYLEKFNLKRIDMELPTVMKDTLNYELWLVGKYVPVKFWSIISILKEREKKNLKTPLYISPMIYSVAAVDQAGNCQKCDKLIRNLFDVYNRTGQIDIFDNLDCECKEIWKREINTESSINDLGERVINIINQLENVEKTQN